MTAGHSSWIGLVHLAEALSPGVAALLLLLFVRTWMNREEFRRRQKRKPKV